MLTFIFLGFAALFLIAGAFISIEAKRRAAGANHHPMPHNDSPRVGRATSFKD
jgi:hypothetical protein